MAARKKKTTRSRTKTSSRAKTRSTRAKSTSSRRKAAPKGFNTGLSLDRKLDITGVGMVLVGILTVLSALSTTNGSLTGAWIRFLTTLFGWGAYILPVALSAIGAWLILRNFERIPTVSVERMVGMITLFLTLLILLHSFAGINTSEQAYAIASVGGGGGYLGAFFAIVLRNGLGLWGLGIALLAGALIGLALTLDVPVWVLFNWVPPLWERFRTAWDQRQMQRDLEKRRRLADQPTIPPPPNPLQNSPAISTSPVGQAKAPSPAAATQAGPALVEASNHATQMHIAAEVEPRTWVLPEVSTMLDRGMAVDLDSHADDQRASVIEETLASFGAPVKVVEIHRGPTITQFGVEPDFVQTRMGQTRVRVNKISSLADDLALALAASRIRVEAPVPGKGYVGIEVPNDQITAVNLRDVIESDGFQRMGSSLRFALGQDVAGNAVSADLSAMPHMLIAGATGSGKSVCVNALITCLLLHNTPETLRMIMVDPKRVELTGYNGIPHLLAPVVVEIDRVVGVLQWVTREMDSRYQKFSDVGARNIHDYNNRALLNPAQIGKPLPFLVVVIDELADLMMVAPDQTERLVTRLAQLARATGIHLVISTQRPSVDVVTGLIKANVPSRISFATASSTDSRVILDQPGAERLLGRGDMLFQAPDAPAPVRMQGVFVSDPEIMRLVQFWRGFAGTASTAPVATATRQSDLPPNVHLKQTSIPFEGVEDMERVGNQDALFDESVDFVRRQGRASISMLQRHLRIGYTRAARIIEDMEARGIIGSPQGGAHTREILDYGQAAPPAGER